MRARSRGRARRIALVRAVAVLACAWLALACDAKDKESKLLDASIVPDVRVSDARVSDAAMPSGPDATSEGECRSHRTCVEKHGAHWICRADHTCVSLLSPECTLVRGDDANDDAVFVGVLSVDGAPLFGASDLARSDFTDAVGGLPTLDGQKQRPFVLVGCSFAFGEDPLPAARYLVETIGVPAIVGPQASQTTINVAQNVTIPAGVLLMSPLAQSDLVTSLQDDDLVFRTSPTTTAVAPQIAAMVADVEATARAERALTNIKVALVSTRDAYGLALSAATEAELHFNGGLTAVENEKLGQFLAISYDPAEPNFEQDVAARVVEFGATIVIALTPAEQRAFKTIEESFAADATNAPYYLMVGFAADSIKFVAERAGSLRMRIRFVSSFDPTRPLYQEYVKRIEQEFGNSPNLLSGGSTYDAAYAVAFGIIAAAASPPTGQAIANGIRRLVAGKKIDALREQIGPSVKILQDGGEINLAGVSGDLDFDADGNVTADGSVQCLAPDAKTGQLALAFGGQTYRADDGKLEGSFQCEQVEKGGP